MEKIRNYEQSFYFNNRLMDSAILDNHSALHSIKRKKGFIKTSEGEERIPKSEFCLKRYLSKGLKKGDLEYLSVLVNGRDDILSIRDIHQIISLYPHRIAKWTELSQTETPLKVCRVVLQL